MGVSSLELISLTAGSVSDEDDILLDPSFEGEKIDIPAGRRFGDPLLSLGGVFQFPRVQETSERGSAATLGRSRKVDLSI